MASSTYPISSPKTQFYQHPFCELRPLGCDASKYSSGNWTTKKSFVKKGIEATKEGDEALEKLKDALEMIDKLEDELLAKDKGSEKGRLSSER